MLSQCSKIIKPARITENFDQGWDFHRGDIDSAQSMTFDDSYWRKLNLPHDWSIENLPGRDTPFDSNAVGEINTGYLTGGTSWYRKTFTVPTDLKGKHFFLEFEGVYMNADVWLNGRHLGYHPYGYTSFGYDISKFLKYGEKNLLAVRVRNEGKNSRWYSGSGIYRHVWMIITGPVHITHWGTYITTPDITESFAKVRIKNQIVNETDKPASISVITRILDNRNNEVARGTTKDIIRNSQSEVVEDIRIPSPVLWSPESPFLYRAVTTVISGKGYVLDSVETKFGIRTLTFNVKQGFLLNGKPTLLKGGCMHHDNGPLGAAAYDRAEVRRVELMKASGFNAVRCAHNPPSRAFLNACDSLGMLVIDEAFDCWEIGKNPQDYHLYFDNWWQRDIESMVVRDRNHPSIILWSIGNEIPERGKPEGVRLARTLGDYVRSLDPTRPVTSAVNGLQEDKDPFFAALDVCGYNYAKDHYVKDHQRVPHRIMVATESFPLEAFDYWMGVLDHPWVVGDFVWTGYDYLGEASIGWLGYPHKGTFYPWNHAFCGDIDICGWKRPQSYYRDAIWKKDQISLFVTPPKPSFPINPDKSAWSKWNWDDVVSDWNWKGFDNKPFKVTVYSSCEEAELFLNGRSLGRKPTNRTTRFVAVWEVPYQSGTLTAIGYNKKEKVNSAQLTTAGKPEKINLSSDRKQIKANGEDLSYITVELTDNNGIVNPKADNLVRFAIEGPGLIIAVGNSNPRSTESFQNPKR